MHKWVPCIAVAVVGCASVVPLNSGGEHVRLITADDAKACKFIQNVAYTETSQA